MANYNLVQAVFDRSLLSPDEDVAVITMHIREAVQGAPDILPVTDEGRQVFTTAFGEFYTAIKGFLTARQEFKELRFYDIPASAGPPMGDPVAIKTFDAPGTSSSGPLPPQIAMSVTWKTDIRLRWGRFYLPGLTIPHIDPNGRWSTTTTAAVAAAAHHLTDRSRTGGVLVVFSRKHWTHTDPTQIQVDDVPDVVRRRRFSVPHDRAIVSAG